MIIGLRAGQYSRVQAIQPASRWDLLPGGHQVKGVNLTSNNMPNTPVNPGGWAKIWVDWDWTGWLKPQIDKALAIGINTIHIHGTNYGRTGSGSTGGTASGPYAEVLSLATYLAEWDQILSYCRSIGMYVYPGFNADSAICEYTGYGGYTPSDAFLTAEYTALAGVLGKYLDIVIGFDMAIESRPWAVAHGSQFYPVVKAVEPRLKLAWSCDYATAPTVWSNLNLAYNSFDFIDIHNYWDATATDLDWLMNYWTKPVLIGEFGQNIGTTPNGTSNNPGGGTPARQSRYNGALAMVNNVTSGRRLAGACAWCMYDQNQDGVLNNSFGMYDQAGNRRSDVSAIFDSFPS